VCEPLVETILWVHCLITCPRQCAFADCLRLDLLIASRFQPHEKHEISPAVFARIDLQPPEAVVAEAALDDLLSLLKMSSGANVFEISDIQEDEAEAVQ
jgi:hypothetical protein